MIDTVVIGAGHNGLVAAAYLAAAGERVVVVERDSIPGGAVSTVERFPGYRVDRGSSAHLMIRHTPILEELALADHGLRYLDCDPWAFSPADDTHEPIIFYKDLDRTCASIENACGSGDAEAYRAFVAVWSERSAAMMSAFTSSPSPIALGKAFWGLQGRIPGKGASSGLGLSQEFLMSGDSLLDYWFDSEQLKAALAWFGAQSGPPTNEPGTAPMVGFAAAMHTIPPGRAIGGSGALTEALVRKLEADGGEVRLSAAATALEKSGDDWLVRCEDGSRLRARSVVSACHVLTTLQLLRAGGFDSATVDRWVAQIRVGNGIGMAVRLGGTALPSYRGIGDDAGVHSALGLLVTDRGQLARAYADASAGDLPRRPALVAMSYSAIDPTLTPAGHHSTSLWAQWHPYRLSGGRSWSDLAAEAAAGIVAELDRHAPGFSDSIEHTRIQTPADLETELGLTGGNIMHVEMSLDQMMIWRPHPEMAQHRIPGAPGLVLAGASTHPGGGVCGASGRIAATAVLAGATFDVVEDHPRSMGMTATDTRFAASTALLVVSIAAQITYPLVEGTTRDKVSVVVVLAAAAAMVLHAAARLGVLRTVGMVAATAGVGWTAEIIGTATSFPFGAYEYATGRIGPSIADVPIVIGLAWTAGGYCIWWISSFITREPWFRIPLATAGMVGWDLYLDPQMVSAGLWTWATRDAGLPGIEQIPVTNFLGWAGVAAVMFTLLSFIDRQPIVFTWRSAITPIGWFTWTWLGSALAFLVFLDDPQLPAAVPYGFVGMGIVGVPAAISLFGALAGRRHASS